MTYPLAPTVGSYSHGISVHGGLSASVRTQVGRPRLSEAQPRDEVGVDEDFLDELSLEAEGRSHCERSYLT